LISKRIPLTWDCPPSLNPCLGGCCGGGGGLYSLNNEMANEIAYGRLSRDVVPLGVDGLVTCCPVCYLNFKRTATKKKAQANVYDLTEIVALSTRK